MQTNFLFFYFYIKKNPKIFNNINNNNKYETKKYIYIFVITFATVLVGVWSPVSVIGLTQTIDDWQKLQVFQRTELREQESRGKGSKQCNFQQEALWPRECLLILCYKHSTQTYSPHKSGTGKRVMMLHWEINWAQASSSSIIKSGGKEKKSGRKEDAPVSDRHGNRLSCRGLAAVAWRGVS